jgi:hypothetical protein
VELDIAISDDALGAAPDGDIFSGRLLGRIRSRDATRGSRPEAVFDSRRVQRRLNDASGAVRARSAASIILSDSLIDREYPLSRCHRPARHGVPPMMSRAIPSSLSAALSAVGILAGCAGMANRNPAADYAAIVGAPDRSEADRKTDY